MNGPAVHVAAGVDVPTPDPGTEWVVGAVVPDETGRIYLHRRTPDRQLLPGAWDIPGGHVERDESVLAALARELEEETGWRLERVLADLGRVTWSDAGQQIEEIDYIVTVAGDLAAPRLEAGKHDAFAWIGPADIEILRVSRRKGDQLLYEIVRRGFEWLASHGSATLPAD